MNTAPITFGNPIISAPLTLGAPTTPSLIAPAAGNAVVPTGYNPAAVPTFSAPMAQAAYANQIAATPTVQNASVAGGGVIADALKTGVQKLVDFASRGSKGVQDALDGALASKGEVDPATLQKATMEMTKYENMMALAKKIQESEQNLASIWLR